jgi:hypothetical protein
MAARNTHCVNVLVSVLGKPTELCTLHPLSRQDPRGHHAAAQRGRRSIEVVEETG